MLLYVVCTAGEFVWNAGSIVPATRYLHLISRCVIFSMYFSYFSIFETQKKLFLAKNQKNIIWYPPLNFHFLDISLFEKPFVTLKYNGYETLCTSYKFKFKFELSFDSVCQLRPSAHSQWTISEKKTTNRRVNILYEQLLRVTYVLRF
jgi:hypothetical protein